MDGHPREVCGKFPDERLHDDILPVGPAIRMVRHAHDEFVHLVDFYELLEPRKEVRLVAVDGLARKRHAELGIRKRDPYTVFPKIKSEVVHTTSQYRHF